MKTSYAVALALVSLSSAALATAENAPAPAAQPQPAVPIATQPQDPAQPSVDSAKNPKDKKICRRMLAPTGTRVGARTVCRTAAEWRRISAIAKETTDEIQKRKGFDGL